MPAVSQTMRWRQVQPWYAAFRGKKNECEKFQKVQLQDVLRQHVLEDCKGLRLNMRTFQMQRKYCPNKSPDGFDWTEDFDAMFNHEGSSFYVNFKFVSGAGGGQTSRMRETYHFINAQLNHLLRYPYDPTYFVNVLDGNASHQSMQHFQYLLHNSQYDDVRHHIYVGDTHSFPSWWRSILKIKKSLPE